MLHMCITVSTLRIILWYSRVEVILNCLSPGRKTQSEIGYILTDGRSDTGIFVQDTIRGTNILAYYR